MFVNHFYYKLGKCLFTYMYVNSHYYICTRSKTREMTAGQQTKACNLFLFIDNPPTLQFTKSPTVSTSGADKFAYIYYC